MKGITVIMLLLLSLSLVTALNATERTAYLEYFNYTGTYCDEENCTNETEDVFLNRTTTNIKHEPYDEEVCGFELSLNNITLEVPETIEGKTIYTSKEVVMLCQLMVCTTNPISKGEHEDKMKQKETDSVVKAWNKNKEKPNKQRKVSR